MKKLILLAALSLGCGDDALGDPEPEQPAEVDPHAPIDPPRPEDATEHWDDPGVPWGEPQGYDDDNGQGDVTDKTTIVPLHGWALRGTNQFDSAGNEHWYPAYTGAYGDDHFGFASQLLGRCGRFDGLKDNAWMPCAVPAGARTRANPKSWTYRINMTNCPDVQPWQTDNFVAGIDGAFAAAALTSSWTFTKTTGTPNIEVYCAGPVEAQAMDQANAPRGAIGVGYISGAVTQGHIGPSATYDVCEDPNFPQVERFAHFVDWYGYYNRSRIGINWRLFWAELTACSSTDAFLRRGVKSVILHEIGHTLGFSHSNVSGGLDTMHAIRSCNFFNRSRFAFEPYYREALNNADLPHYSTGLNLIDSEISCYRPN